MKDKIKTCLSVLFLLAFAVIGGGSTEDLGVYLISGAVAFVVVTTLMLIINSSKAKAENKAKQTENERLRQLALVEKERLTKAYEIQKNAFINQHGVPDSTIYLKDYDINEEINVYENQKKVFIRSKAFEFKDILSCTFTDNPTTIKGKISSVSESKTDNGNALGRAIVGGAIAGSTGAIIGGTTAKRQTQTEYRQENDRIYHDYTVIINVNSISNPVIRINTGENGRLTNEIVGLMNVIISRK